MNETSNVGDMTQPSCQLHIVNTSGTRAFSLHLSVHTQVRATLTSSLSFYTIFLTSLSPVLIHPSLSLHYSQRFAKSNLIRSTTLLQNTFMRSPLSFSFQDMSSGARRSGCVCSVAFGVEDLASQGSRVPPSWHLGAGLWAYCVPYLDVDGGDNSWPVLTTGKRSAVTDVSPDWLSSNPLYNYTTICPFSFRWPSGLRLIWGYYE